ncbi:unnamed protein product [Closterium sp. Yama58-4]|nr:unnamed protein product [Closterium sp. Yama58-4]
MFLDLLPHGLMPNFCACACARYMHEKNRKLRLQFEGEAAAGLLWQPQLPSHVPVSSQQLASLHSFAAPKPAVPGAGWTPHEPLPDSIKALGQVPAITAAAYGAGGVGASGNGGEVELDGGWHVPCDPRVPDEGWAGTRWEGEDAASKAGMVAGDARHVESWQGGVSGGNVGYEKNEGAGAGEAALQGVQSGASGSIASRLFEGVVIWVNGYTQPTHQELRQLMLVHGGVFENYYHASRVTHIICANFADTKLVQFRKSRTLPPVVHPNWVVACIHANRLLPLGSFLLRRLALDHPDQKTLPSTFFRAKTAPQPSSSHSPARIAAVPANQVSLSAPLAIAAAPAGSAANAAATVGSTGTAFAPCTPCLTHGLDLHAADAEAGAVAAAAACARTQATVIDQGGVWGTRMDGGREKQDGWAEAEAADRMAEGAKKEVGDEKAGAAWGDWLGECVYGDAMTKVKAPQELSCCNVKKAGMGDVCGVGMGDGRCAGRKLEMGAWDGVCGDAAGKKDGVSDADKIGGRDEVGKMGGEGGEGDQGGQGEQGEQGGERRVKDVWAEFPEEMEEEVWAAVEEACRMRKREKGEEECGGIGNGEKEGGERSRVQCSVVKCGVLSGVIVKDEAMGAGKENGKDNEREARTGGEVEQVGVMSEAEDARGSGVLRGEGEAAVVDGWNGVKSVRAGVAAKVEFEAPHAGSAGGHAGSAAGHAGSAGGTTVCGPGSGICTDARVGTSKRAVPPREARGEGSAEEPLGAGGVVAKMEDRVDSGAEWARDDSGQGWRGASGTESHCAGSGQSGAGQGGAGQGGAAERDAAGAEGQGGMGAGSGDKAQQDSVKVEVEGGPGQKGSSVVGTGVERVVGQGRASSSGRGRAHSTQTDPNFVQNYFRHSRLHFIGSWRNRYRPPAARATGDGAEGTEEAGRGTGAEEEPEEGDKEEMALERYMPHTGALWNAETGAGSKAGAGSKEGVEAYKPGKEQQVERVVVHVDMDCFFVAVSLLSHPHLRGKPVAVCYGGRGRRAGRNAPAAAHSTAGAADAGGLGVGVGAGASYDARAFGVRAGMFLREARRRCPQLQLLPYDFEAYERVADECLSCDEALLELPPISNTSTSSSSTAAGAAAAAAADPEAVVARMRAEIEARTRCTASAGIAHNIMLARVATRKAKPNGQFRITKDKALDFLHDLPVSDLHGVGWVLSSKLHAASIHTCGDLRALSRASLQAEHGVKTGDMLWRYARGMDDRAVVPAGGKGKNNQQQAPVAAARKSIGADVNWGVRFRGQEDAEKFLRDLVGEVCGRLDAAGVAGRSVCVKVMVRAKGEPVEPLKFMGHGRCDTYSRSRSLGPAATADPNALFRAARALFLAVGANAVDVRGVGLQVYRLEPVGGKGLGCGAFGSIERVCKKSRVSMLQRREVEEERHEEEDGEEVKGEVAGERGGLVGVEGDGEKGSGRGVWERTEGALKEEEGMEREWKGVDLRYRVGMDNKMVKEERLEEVESEVEEQEERRNQEEQGKQEEHDEDKKRKHEEQEVNMKQEWQGEEAEEKGKVTEAVVARADVGRQGGMIGERLVGGDRVMQSQSQSQEDAVMRMGRKVVAEKQVQGSVMEDEVVCGARGVGAVTEPCDSSLRNNGASSRCNGGERFEGRGEAGGVEAAAVSQHGFARRVDDSAHVLPPMSQWDASQQEEQQTGSRQKQTTLLSMFPRATPERTAPPEGQQQLSSAPLHQASVSAARPASSACSVPLSHADSRMRFHLEGEGRSVGGSGPASVVARQSSSTAGVGSELHAGGASSRTDPVDPALAGAAVEAGEAAAVEAATPGAGVQHVGLSLSQIDPSVLAELSPSLQREILASLGAARVHEREHNSTRRAQCASAGACEETEPGRLNEGTAACAGAGRAACSAARGVACGAACCATRAVLSMGEARGGGASEGNTLVQRDLEEAHAVIKAINSLGHRSSFWAHVKATLHPQFQAHMADAYTGELEM